MIEPTIKKSKIDEYFRTNETIIFGLFKEYRFLSNFHICPVVYDKLEYSSSEAAYQAAKCTNQEERIKFTSMTPKQARDAGQLVALRRDWEEVKLQVMLDVLYSKFSLTKDLQHQLMATGHRQIHEANHWGDKFWGIDGYTCEGKDWLGRILMSLRKTFTTINISQ